jgi:hypothetical protein
VNRRHAKIYLGTTLEKCLNTKPLPDWVVYANGAVIDPIEDKDIREEEDPEFEVLSVLDGLDLDLGRDPDYCDRHAVVLCFGYRPKRFIDLIKSRDWPVTVVNALRL